MEPQAKTASQSTNGWEPKWRQFNPLSRVWVQNPFDHDVVYRVADEFNRPFEYLLPAKKVSELPGGAIATLGVKAIVDELIQNSEKDAVHMWDKLVRAKHEATVIVREKETRPLANPANPGVIDLSVKTNEVATTPEAPTTAPETAFPGLNEAPGNELAPLPAAAAAGLDDLVKASLPTSDAVASPNNAHANAEG